MGDEKSIAEKLTEAIGKAATSVKNAVSHVVDTASDAAQHAMEVNAEKISRIPPARPDPEQVAGTTNEQLYIPEANDAAAMPMPLIPVAPEPKKKRASKPAKTAAKRSPGKKSKLSAGKTGVGKNKKAVKKTGKKPKRQ
jgi:hypothetical protein